MLLPPRELELRALDAPDDMPPKPPLLRDELEGTLRLPTLSPPAELEPARFAPVLLAPVRLAPTLLAPAVRAEDCPAAPWRVWPSNLLAEFWLAYGAPPR